MWPGASVVGPACSRLSMPNPPFVAPSVYVRVAKLAHSLQSHYLGAAMQVSVCSLLRLLSHWCSRAPLSTRPWMAPWAMQPFVCCPFEPFLQELLLACSISTSWRSSFEGYVSLHVSLCCHLLCIGLVFDSLSSDRRLYADQSARVKRKFADPGTASGGQLAATNGTMEQRRIRYIWKDMVSMQFDLCGSILVPKVGAFLPNMFCLGARPPCMLVVSISVCHTSMWLARSCNATKPKVSVEGIEGWSRSGRAYAQNDDAADSASPRAAVAAKGFWYTSRSGPTSPKENHSATQSRATSLSWPGKEGPHPTWQGTATHDAGGDKEDHSMQ